ncbi:kinesin-like protein KIF3B [Macrosteles quadrilineatus]|uniref:kinesin-like protein KIF3B n=1 Tax=Macrosteles quadrilineatus TaxID=74068 RepID=UPI0023E16831|nr:kinesin-like protein KIF3B [Macrosteles quadrilineatus]
MNNDAISQRNEMVQVAIRCRPMNDKEIAKNYSCVVKIEPSDTVKLYDPRLANSAPPKTFEFDATFDGTASQSEVYDRMVQPLVDAVLSGYNGTVFVFGQSGSGKTYTMEASDCETDKGILPRTFHNIFENISKSCDTQYLIRISYLEIYKDEIRDLLERKIDKKYEIRESKDSGVYVKDISSYVCKSQREINKIIKAGRRNRIVASTDINERSSRSHAIVMITVEMKDLSEGRVRVGKLNLVDLAGSERQNKTCAEGDRLKEANKINLSLSALGNVISALSENKSNYIPYRDSKLTRILKDSLGGNSKTVMIANIGPACYNYDETLNTLRYASRAKNIRNVPQVNENPVDTLIRRYQEEIKILKSQLQERVAEKNLCNSNARITEFGDSQKNYLITKGNNEVSVQKSITDVTKCHGNNKIKENDSIMDLKKQIDLMESNLLVGNKNILEYTEEQKKSLEKRDQKINRIKEREEEIHQVIEKEKEFTEGIKKDFYNLKQEVEYKRKDLTKKYFRLQEIHQEIQDAKDEYNEDRRELEITQQEILKDIKLKLLIIENFIPKEKRRQLYPRMYYDPNLDSWQLKPNYEFVEGISKPRCFRNNKSHEHVSKRTRHRFRQSLKDNRILKPHNFKGDNILDLDLIRPPPTTKEYLNTSLPTRLNTAFKAALQLEEDIDIDAKMCLSAHKFTTTSSDSLELIFKDIFHQTSSRTQKFTTSTPNYPKARGLVPK